MSNSGKKRLITHDGSFHSDDLFACATLAIYLDQKGEDYEILRTRDADLMSTGDYVFDVGGVYDPERNRFDHHQSEGAGVRENGIPYASFGVVWKHFGREICGGDEEVWKVIDTKIASPIDAGDNGVDLCEERFEGVRPYAGESAFLIFSPTWKETDININDVFVEQVKRIKEILLREIKVVSDDVEGKRNILKAYEEAEDKRVVEIGKGYPRYLYQSTLASLSDVVYVVYPSVYGENWKVEAISKKPGTFESRKLFPESWRGYINNDPKLPEITGVSDAFFSHRNGFLMSAKSRAGAYELAKKALEA